MIVVLMSTFAARSLQLLCHPSFPKAPLITALAPFRSFAYSRSRTFESESIPSLGTRPCVLPAGISSSCDLRVQHADRTACAGASLICNMQRSDPLFKAIQERGDSSQQQAMVSKSLLLQMSPLFETLHASGRVSNWADGQLSTSAGNSHIFCARRKGLSLQSPN